MSKVAGTDDPVSAAASPAAHPKQSPTSSASTTQISPTPTQSSVSTVVAPADSHPHYSKPEPISVHQTSKSSPLTVGHRGFKGKYPENTLYGFDRSVSSSKDSIPGGNVDVIELDVHVSKDGIVVISHDPETGRCFKSIKDSDNDNDDNDGKKKKKKKNKGYKISETLYKGVMEDELISVSAADFPGVDPSQLGLPSLLKVADRIVNDPRYANVHLMLDIKSRSNDAATVFDKLVSTLLQVHPDLHGFWIPRITFGIWTLDFLEACQASPQAKLFKVVHIGISRRLARRFVEASAVGSGEVVGISLLTVAYAAPFGGREIVEYAKDRGVKTFAWTVNEVKWMRFAVEVGLDGVVTDYPDRFNEVKEEMSKKEEGQSLMMTAVATDEKPITWFKKNVLCLIEYGLVELIAVLFLG